MALKAGFAEIDITPPPGTKKVGWMQDLSGDVILDPLFARVAVFDDGTTKIGFIQLDTLSTRWTQVHDIRQRISQAYGFPGENVMVSATHNHAGPATSGLEPVPRDEGYIETLVTRSVAAFGEALKGMQEVDVGFASGQNVEVAHNRRSIMRDGTTKCQVSRTDPMFLCFEGVSDPDIGVVAVRSKAGVPLGCFVNYACHPTHHGGGDTVSAGFPGLVCRRMKEAGYPVTIYHNGAYGNVNYVNYARRVALSMEEAGESLYQSVQDALSKLNHCDNPRLHAVKRTLELDYRTITEAERRGKVFGAQRFRSDELYEQFIDTLIAKIAAEKRKKAEIQVLGIGDIFFAGVPAEYFVEFQVQIKTATYPRRSFVVGGANGMMGYVPTRAAFGRGGYETTLGPPSIMAPGTGETIADTIIALIKEVPA
jgi:hypothetical protein